MAISAFRSFHLTSTVISLLLASSVIRSQEPTLQPRPGVPAGATVLQTGTKLVVVDVIVQDRNGHPVRGLKREDFVLTEGKAPQTLRAFDEFSTDPSAPAVIPQAPKLPPGSFTDYTPVPDKGPLNILLIDGVNTSAGGQLYLRQQLADYVKHVTPGTRIAIFGLSNQLYLLQGFTSNPKILQAALGNNKVVQNSSMAANSSTDGTALLDSMTDLGSTPDVGSATSALMTSNIQTFLENVTVSQTISRFQLTLEAFTALGHWLSNFPGRKNLIWFSEAFPLGVVPNVSFQNKDEIPGEDSDQFRAMTNLLTQARVSVYPVDPRGLQTDPAFEQGDVLPNQISAAASASPAFYNQKASEHTTMQVFASDTGGVPFYNRNNLSAAVTDAINDGANYYTLAYTPTEHKTKGEWRSIHVELSSEASHRGFRLSYRRGYYAENLTQGADKQIGKASLTTAAFTSRAAGQNYARSAMLHGAPAPTDIPFTTRVLPHSTATSDTLAASNVLDPKSPIAPPFRNFDVDAAAMPRYFTLTQQPNGNYTGALELAVFVYSLDGKLINTTAKKFTFDFTPDMYAHFTKNVVGIHVEVSTPAKSDSILRIGLQDVPSNRIGAVEVPTAAVRNLAPAN